MIEKLTKEEKRKARELNVNINDLVKTGSCSTCDWWALNNGEYYVKCGYLYHTRQEIYRDLLRKMIKETNC